MSSAYDNSTEKWVVVSVLVGPDDSDILSPSKAAALMECAIIGEDNVSEMAGKIPGRWADRGLTLSMVDLVKLGIEATNELNDMAGVQAFGPFDAADIEDMCKDLAFRLSARLAPYGNGRNLDVVYNGYGAFSFRWE